MKKIIILFFVIVCMILTLTLVSCNNNTEHTTGTEQSSAEPSYTTPTESGSTEPSQKSTTGQTEPATLEDPIIELVKEFVSPSLQMRSITLRITYTDSTTKFFKISVSPLKYSISDHKTDAAFYKLTEGDVSIYIEPYIYDSDENPHRYTAMPNYEWVEVYEEGGTKVRYEDGLLHVGVLSGALELIQDFEEVMKEPGQYEGFIDCYVYDGETEVGMFEIPITVSAE